MKRNWLFLGALLLLLLSSCSYDKEETLFPPVPCDSTGVSFSADIMPIVDAQCLSCHDMSSSAGGVVMEQYSDFEFIVADTSLIRSLEYTTPYRMPPAGKLPDCDIAKFRSWIRDGALNN